MKARDDPGDPNKESASGSADANREQETKTTSSSASDPPEEEGERKRPAQRKTSGIPPQFPRLLHNMLCRADEGGYSSIVSWLPHGKSFLIHNRDEFVAKVMPMYFKQTRFASFQRQLNLYGFLRVERKGPDHKSYYHERFLRDEPQLVETIGRIQSKGTSTFATWMPKPDPDFSGKQSEQQQQQKKVMAGAVAAARGLHAAAASAATVLNPPVASMPVVPVIPGINPAAGTAIGMALPQAAASGILPGVPREFWAPKPPPPAATQQQQQPQQQPQQHTSSPSDSSDQKLPGRNRGSSSDSTADADHTHKESSSMAQFLEDVDLEEDST